MGTESQETNTQAQQTEPEASKTFTQAEVDLIVKERLGRERAKYEGFEDFKAKAMKFDELEEANKSELDKAHERVSTLEAELNKMKKDAEVRAIREKVAKEAGIPMASMSLLTGETEEACLEQAKTILAIAQPNTSYPQLKDGGELTTTMKSSTRQQFADWANQAFN